MSKTNEMVEALEDYIIQKVRSFNENTSPDELTIVADLVNAVTRTPRAIEIEPISPIGVATFKEFASAGTEVNMHFINLIKGYLQELENLSKETDITFLKRKIDLASDIGRLLHVIRL